MEIPCSFAFIDPHPFVEYNYILTYFPFCALSSQMVLYRDKKQAG